MLKLNLISMKVAIDIYKKTNEEIIVKSRTLSTIGLCALLVTFISCEKAIIPKKVDKKVSNQAQESLVIAQEKSEFFNIEIAGAHTIQTDSSKRYFEVKEQLNTLLIFLGCKDIKFSGDTDEGRFGHHRVSSITASCVQAYDLEINAREGGSAIVYWYKDYSFLDSPLELEVTLNRHPIVYNTDEKLWRYVFPEIDENGELKIIRVNYLTFKKMQNMYLDFDLADGTRYFRSK